MRTALSIILPIAAVAGVILTIVSMEHWKNTYQFGDFLVAFPTILITLTVFLVYQWRLRAPQLVIRGYALALIGGISNFVVMAVNGGFMPATLVTIPYNEYIPMEGAKLTWLADWILRGASPGDMLLFLGIGLIALGTLLSIKRGIKGGKNGH